MNTERSGRVEERRGCEGESTSMGWVVRQCHFLISFLSKAVGTMLGD